MKMIFRLVILTLLMCGCGGRGSIAHIDPQDGELLATYRLLDDHPFIKMEGVGYSYVEGSVLHTRENLTGAGLSGFLLRDSRGDVARRFFMVTYVFTNGQWKYSHVGLGWEEGYDHELYKADSRMLEEIYHGRMNGFEPAAGGYR